MGRTLFRRTVASGGGDRLGYSIEAYRWQGEFQHAWKDVGVLVRLKSKIGYDSAEFRLDYHNLAVEAVELARVRDGVLHLRLKATQFNDSIELPGSYQLLFYRDSGAMRSCLTTDYGAVPAEKSCQSSEAEAGAWFGG